MRLVDFNLNVARFAHASWFPDAVRGVMPDAYAQSDARLERHLSDWLLRELGLQTDMDWQMEEPQKRLFLLDRQGVETLTYELAVAMHRDWLARVIDGSRLRELQRRVDDQSLRFAVEEIPQGLFRHRSPTVDFESGATGELAAALKDDGARTLLALLSPAWRAVWCRAQLRFDGALSHAATVFSPARRDKALELICAHVIPKRLPQWAWLF